MMSLFNQPLVLLLTFERGCVFFGFSSPKCVFCTMHFSKICQICNILLLKNPKEFFFCKFCSSNSLVISNHFPKFNFAVAIKRKPFESRKRKLFIGVMVFIVTCPFVSSESLFCAPTILGNKQTCDTLFLSALLFKTFRIERTNYFPINIIGVTLIVANKNRILVHINFMLGMQLSQE